MIILASNSWLRRTIMEASRLPFRVETAEVDERSLEAQHSAKGDETVAMILAEAKAHAIHEKYPDDLVIAADTFAVLPGGERLHKPATPEEAIELCLVQSGKTIRAVTGITMAYKDTIVTDHCSTDITYMEFDRAIIEELLKGDDATVRNSGLGFFSDAPGFTLVASYNGSYTGAMGLPMEIVRENIRQLGYKV